MSKLLLLPAAVDRHKEMSLTPQYILQGFAYALEQCGLLLRDANLLYRNGAYANAFVLTAFARVIQHIAWLLAECIRRGSVHDRAAKKCLR